MVLTIESKIEKISAHQKSATSKPDTITSTNKIINALITSKKTPNVKMVIGMVSAVKIGFTNEFTNAITIAAIMAAPTPATVIPGNRYAKIRMDSVLTIIPKMMFFIV